MAHVWVFTVPFVTLAGLQGRENSSPEVLTPVLMVPPASLAEVVVDKSRNATALINIFCIFYRIK